MNRIWGNIKHLHFSATWEFVRLKLPDPIIRRRTLLRVYPEAFSDFGKFDDDYWIADRLVTMESFNCDCYSGCVCAVESRLWLEQVYNEIKQHPGQS